jgi:hypothetical protein
MVQNKTKPTTSGVAEFLDTLTEETQRKDTEALIQLMRSATGEEPKMWGSSIIGFGSHHYRYESGHEGDMPMAGFSPRKAAFALYGITAVSDSAALLAKLGKHTTGKGCLYIRRLADVNAKVLQTLIVKSVKARRAANSP